MADDIGNPFDKPLNSELQESAQRRAATPPLDTGYVNPFDEPLASEKAEAAHAAAMEKSRPKSYLQQALQPEGDIQNPMQPGESFALAHPEEQGTLAAASIIGAGGAALTEAGPVLAAIGNHLDTLKKVVDYAKTIGLTGLEYEGARKLWKEFTSKEK
jgi:uncharacterized protein GlcG (DUF336 family)